MNLQEKRQLLNLLRQYNRQNNLIKQEDNLSKYNIKQLKGDLDFETLKKKYSWLLKCKLSDAVLGLSKDGYLLWYSGTFESGTWKDGIWLDGTWQNGTWKDGNWKKGTWLRGTWERGIWQDGTWKNGTWKSGQWRGGKWFDGIWKDKRNKQPKSSKGLLDQ